MSNLVKEIMVNLNGKEYKLRYDYFALYQFKKLTGKDFMQVGSKPSVDDMIYFSYSLALSGGLTDEPFEDFIKNISPTDTALRNAIKDLISDGSAKVVENKDSAGSEIPLAESPQS